MSLLPEHGKMMVVCSESGEQERGLYDHACRLLNFPRLLGRAFTPSAGALAGHQLPLLGRMPSP